MASPQSAAMTPQVRPANPKPAPPPARAEHQAPGPARSETVSDATARAQTPALPLPVSANYARARRSTKVPPRRRPARSLEAWLSTLARCLVSFSGVCGALPRAPSATVTRHPRAPEARRLAAAHPGREFIVYELHMVGPVELVNEGEPS
jgi:hypothetical protein